MRKINTIDWIEPLSLAGSVEDEETWMLLYSSMKNEFTGAKSFLCLAVEDKVRGDSFKEFAEKLSSNKNFFDNIWFGYLGYGLKNSLETLPEDKKGIIDTDDLSMVKFGLILEFEHDKKQVNIWADSEKYVSKIPKVKSRQPSNIKVTDVKSNMSKVQYLQNIDKIKKFICNGDIYQANLTRKFFGNIDKNTNYFDIFCRLCEISPAPYSSYLKMGDTVILSSSPEQFLHVDENGKAVTRPIKGSAPRYDDKRLDKQSLKNLQSSEKDKAENLMIVDLSRNDLTRSCEIGSVNASKLFDITAYNTIYHLASTVRGSKRSDVPALDLVKNCFPPGSMTGAPKIQAMKICSEIEQIKRGVYSGCIGYFAGDGSLELSVVIRTIIIKDGKLEFQVGGAITSDSNPESEWQETMAKAKGMAKSLGIDINVLEGC